MKKRIIVWFLLAAMLLSLFACGAAKSCADGTYTVSVTLSGGTGRATIESPAKLTVQDGRLTLAVVWSSDKYDYMLVNGEKLLPEYVDGHSVFQVPVETLDEPLTVTADTTAMSTPHEIDYEIAFDAASLSPVS